MKTTALAILGAAVAVRATGDDDHDKGLYKGPIGFPPGIVAPPPEFLPHKPPPFEKPLPIWHPPHEGVFIDDCEEEDHDWHWAWDKHKDKPHHGPPHKWTTTSVTVTKTEEKAGPTEVVTETVCPVPVTDEPAPPAKPTDDKKPHPKPPKDEPAPPKPTAPPADEGEAPPEPEAPGDEEPPAAPPADEPEEEKPEASGEPEPEAPPAQGGVGKNAAGILAVVAGAVAALF